MPDDWDEELGNSMSVLKTYSLPTSNFVLYADNPGDFHHDQHYLPFLDALIDGGNIENLRVHKYAFANGHWPPNPTEFSEVMAKAFEWLKELPESSS